MSYNTKEISFTNTLAHLDRVNTFAFKMFCRQELTNDVGYEKFLSAEMYNDNNLPEFNQAMLSRLSAFLLNVDEDLHKEVFCLASESALYREVLEHFEQDECPLALEQDFEVALDRLDSSYDDKISMYMNEY